MRLSLWALTNLGDHPQYELVLRRMTASSILSLTLIVALTAPAHPAERPSPSESALQLTDRAVLNAKQDARLIPLAPDQQQTGQPLMVDSPVRLDSKAGRRGLAVKVASAVGEGTDEVSIRPAQASTANLVNGRAVLRETGNVTHVLEGLEDGGRVLTIVGDATRTVRVEHEVALPSGTHLVPRADGSIAVEVMGEDPDVPIGVSVATIDPAWAVDERGRDVPTHYEVRDASIVQVIHGGEYEGAVVADPRVRNCTPYGFYGFCIDLNRGDMRRVGPAAVTSAGVYGALSGFCGLIPNALAKVACTTALAMSAAKIASDFVKARADGKCVTIAISSIPAAAVTLANPSRVVNCYG